MENKRAQQLEKFKQELGIDEAIIGEATRKNISTNLSEVKHRFDRVMIETAIKLEDKYKPKP